MANGKDRKLIKILSASLAGAAILCFALYRPAQSVPDAVTPGADASQMVGDMATWSDPVPEIASRARPAVVQVVTTVSKDGGEADYGSGSGVYVDSRGYFVTNKHVIDGGDSVYIVTLAGDRYPAQVRGSDDGTDLAVLYSLADIGAEPVAMGDSDALRVGELAVAIGNPGGSGGSVLFGTLTTGVVSALNRTELSAGNFSRVVSVIQTDAAINSGNSGGALLNARGELIGIPTLKLMYDTGSVYEGLGFAIPINTARPIIEEIIAKGRVSRPWLGIGAVSAGETGDTGADVPSGVRVLSVEANSPAEQAGLRVYDILTHADGVRIHTVQELAAILDSHADGESVRLTVSRVFDEEGRRLSTPGSFETVAPIRMGA